MNMLVRILPWVAWNTFLAVIPVALAHAIYGVIGGTGRRPGVVARAGAFLLGIVWLLFMPNTCYLLTEWRHFLNTVGYANLHARWQNDSGAALTLMMYALFYLCYSAVGIITFTLGTRPIARLLKERGAALWIWGMPFFLLMSVGVYLGLILRFNTWDVLNRGPEIWQVVIGILDRPMLMSFVVAFAGFLWAIYLATDIWIDGVRSRLCREPFTRPQGRDESSAGSPSGSSRRSST